MTRVLPPPTSQPDNSVVSSGAIPGSGHVLPSDTRLPRRPELRTTARHVAPSVITRPRRRDRSAGRRRPRTRPMPPPQQQDTSEEDG